MDHTQLDQLFPKSTQYNPEWVFKNSFGGPPLWLCEWLCNVLDLKPGMRVLDLGCGRAVTSLFLAREFGVEVWATDLWISAAENTKRIAAAGLADKVFPLHADARSLPYAAGFFDAVVAVDCYSYFGADDLYLNYLANFVREGGQIGMAGAGLTQEMTSPVPEHLVPIWGQDFWCLHSAGWWREHWARTGIVDVEAAEAMNDGWKVWLAWQNRAHPENSAEIGAVEQDAGRYLGYVRMVGRRREGVSLEDYAWPDNLKSFPEHYEELPMLKQR